MAALRAATFEVMDNTFVKGSIDVDAESPEGLYRFAGLCGWTLARAHAQSGDPRAISGYLGGGDVFDLAMGRFAVAYADQNERDFARFIEAIWTGQVQAQNEE